MTILAKYMYCNFFAFSIKWVLCLAPFEVTVSNTDYFISHFFVKFCLIPFASAIWYDILRLKHGHLTLTASFLLIVVWV